MGKGIWNTLLLPMTSICYTFTRKFEQRRSSLFWAYHGSSLRSEPSCMLAVPTSEQRRVASRAVRSTTHYQARSASTEQGSAATLRLPLFHVIPGSPAYHFYRSAEGNVTCEVFDFIRGNIFYGGWGEAKGRDGELLSGGP